VLVESAVSCDEVQCGTVVVPVVAEVSVDLSDDDLSVAASDGHVSMCVLVRYPGVVAE
jgi:hypothetical protein